MKILYISAMFDYQTYNQLFTKETKPMHAANKYHTLLCQGIVKKGISIRALSALPVNRTNCGKKYVRMKKKKIDGYTQEYPAFFNFPGLRHIQLFFGSFFRTLFSKKGTVVIYDTLVAALSYGAVIAAKLSGKKCISIVTDLPGYSKNQQERFDSKAKNKLMKMADGYIFITRQMDAVVNKKKKPFIVLEGLVDNDIASRPHKPFVMCLKNVVYAGALQKIYGIKNLCESFIECAKPDEKLHIYGEGDYLPELKELLTVHDNIVYHGNRPNQEVVDMELESVLLVNPRPCEGEYTKYSFPSKTLEYMVSGAPVLSARLEGIPDEYDPYLYYFDDTKEDGLQNAIREILDKDLGELETFGCSAREFALVNKNNILQAERVIDFLKEYFC